MRAIAAALALAGAVALTACDPAPARPDVSEPTVSESATSSPGADPCRPPVEKLRKLGAGRASYVSLVGSRLTADTSTGGAVASLELGASDLRPVVAPDGSVLLRTRCPDDTDALWRWRKGRVTLEHRAVRGEMIGAFELLTSNGKSVAWADAPDFSVETLVFVLSSGAAAPRRVPLTRAGAASDLALAPDGRLAIAGFASGGEPRDLFVVAAGATSMDEAPQWTAPAGCRIDGMDWSAAGLFVQQLCGQNATMLTFGDGLKPRGRDHLGQAWMVGFDADDKGRLLGFQLWPDEPRRGSGELVALEGTKATRQQGGIGCFGCLDVPQSHWWGTLR